MPASLYFSGVGPVCYADNTEIGEIPEGAISNFMKQTNEGLILRAVMTNFYAVAGIKPVVTSRSPGRLYLRGLSLCPVLLVSAMPNLSTAYLFSIPTSWVNLPRSRTRGDMFFTPLLQIPDISPLCLC